MRPVAAIDIGSNTVHLLVGAAHRRGPVEHLESQSELLQLGREVRKHGCIRPKKLKAVKRVLREFLKSAREHGVKEVLIGATGAVRAAENGAAAMRKLERALGVPIQVLSPDSEARLAFLGATLTLKKNGPQLLIDSGGSSTEVTLTIGRRRRASKSMPVGASQLCAQLKNDPPGPLEWARLSLQLGDALRKLPTAPQPRRAVAVGGAAHRIEELHGAGRGAPVGLPDLEKIAKRLLRRSSKQIEKATGVPRGKVALLAAGALILHAVLSHYSLESVDIGHSGLRDGMILAHRSVSGNWWRYRR